MANQTNRRERKHDAADPGPIPQLRRYHRRGFLHAALGAAGLALFAACGGSSSTPTTAGGNPTPASSNPTLTSGAAHATAGATPTGAPAATTTRPSGGGTATAAAATRSPAAVDGKIVSNVPGTPDAYLKLPPSFKSVKATPGRGGKVTIFKATQLPPAPPKEQNQYWQELDKRLGVTTEFTQVPISEYREKVAVLTASGDLSDLTLIWPQNAPDQFKAIQQGAYADLTFYLTGDALKGYPNLALYPQYAWKNTAIRGKIYGVPRMSVPGGNVLIYRRDWAEKLGNPDPKNADEVFKLLVDMSQGDPDGNGRPDTFGIGGNTQNFALPFINGMFRVPNGWRLNSDGTLTASVETEEFKQAVTFARRLWEAGAYHPEMSTMTLSQSQDLLIGGTIGAISATVTSLNGGVRARYKLKEFNPSADLRALVPPGNDGGQGVTHNNIGYTGFQGISGKAGRDRERTAELVRLMDFFGAPFGSEEYNSLWFGLEGVHHTKNPDGSLKLTDRGSTERNELFNVVFAPRVIYYPGDPADDIIYSQQKTAEVLAIGIDDPTWSAYSATNVTKANELDQLQRDRITSIITGREPLSAFDGLVRDWRSRGGDQIRKEFEQDLQGR